MISNILIANPAIERKSCKLIKNLEPVFPGGLLTFRSYFNYQTQLKFVTLITLLLFPFLSVKAAEPTLEIAWLGTSSIYISDGETSLFFDPFITRPSKSNVFTLKKLISNTDDVNEWLTKIDHRSTIQAIFVSHTHYDHVLDLVEVARETRAIVYGSQSTHKIIDKANSQPRENDEPKIFYQSIQLPKQENNELSYQTISDHGDFTITILPAKHTPHFCHVTLLKGKIKDSFKLPETVLGYRMGENFSFLIEHPLGNILFHPSSIAVEFEESFTQAKEADLIILGIQKVDDLSDLEQYVFDPFNVKTVIPVHYDYFFKPLKKGVIPFSSVNLKNVENSLHEKGINMHSFKYYGEKYIYNNASLK